MADGGFISEAVAVIDTGRRTGRRDLVEAGGVRPRRRRELNPDRSTMRWAGRT
jgi:hypothetical protein